MRHLTRSLITEAVRRPEVWVSLIAIAAFLTFAVGYLPYWSAAGLIQAAAAEDPERMERFIREGLVAHSVAAQTETAVSSQARLASEEGSEGANPVEASADSATLAATLSSVPALADLVRTHLIADGSRLRTARDLWVSDRAHLSENNRFRVEATGGYVFDWRRTGLRWQLVNVLIPQHVIEAAAISGEDPVVERKVQVFAHPNSSDRAAESSEAQETTTAQPRE